jgi:dTDP-4-amino-4,6-dideoxygalactose transaminase
MKKHLGYGRQSVGMEEERRVRDVLQSDWLTQGPRIVEFEAALARICDVRFAVAVSHGTTALYLACRAAGLGRGDRFITSPISFLATPNAAVMCGARPVFVDIDPNTLNLDADQVAAALKRYKSVKVLLPVHLGGRVCEMDRLGPLCAEHDVTVIEDARHAIGGRWRDEQETWRTVGDCAYSAMTCFSFHQVNNITSGEGGAITTNDPELVAKLRLLRNHGVTRDAAAVRSGSRPWAYEMHELSLNARMTDMQAAMGVVQIEKLPRLKRQRRELVARPRSTSACCTRASGPRCTTSPSTRSPTTARPSRPPAGTAPRPSATTRRPCPCRCIRT